MSTRNRKEIDFTKFKMTPWKKFKRKLYNFLDFKSKGGLWVYLPALILYPIIIGILAISVYNVGVKTGPRAESDHLIAYSIRRDAALANDLVTYLDPYAEDLKKTFNKQFKSKVEMTINRSFKIYSRNVFNLKPRWPQSHSLFVTSEPGNLQMISPVADDMEEMTFYTTDFIFRHARVSLAQDYLNDINYNFKELPMWLSEGLPYYLVADDEDLKHIKTIISNSDTPNEQIMKMDLLRSKLYSIRTDNYTLQHGREYAYAFADFFIRLYGEETVVDWAKDKTFTLSMTGYDTYDALYIDVEAFIKAHYR